MTRIPVAVGQLEAFKLQAKRIANAVSRIAHGKLKVRKSNREDFLAWACGYTSFSDLTLVARNVVGGDVPLLLTDTDNKRAVLRKRLVSSPFGSLTPVQAEELISTMPLPTTPLRLAVTEDVSVGLPTDISIYHPYRYELAMRPILDATFEEYERRAEALVQKNIIAKAKADSMLDGGLYGLCFRDVVMNAMKVSKDASRIKKLGQFANLEEFVSECTEVAFANNHTVGHGGHVFHLPAALIASLSHDSVADVRMDRIMVPHSSIYAYFGDVPFVLSRDIAIDGVYIVKHDISVSLHFTTRQQSQLLNPPTGATKFLLADISFEALLSEVFGDTVGEALEEIKTDTLPNLQLFKPALDRVVQISVNLLSFLGLPRLLQAEYLARFGQTHDELSGSIPERRRNILLNAARQNDLSVHFLCDSTNPASDKPAYLSFACGMDDLYRPSQALQV